MPQFYTLLTDVGQAKLANAVALGTTIEITELAVGDGGGSLPSPDSSATALVNEVRRAAINASQTDPDNPSWIVVEQVLPPDVGGWTIREIGIVDVDGDLIGIGNYPETYKPVLAEGSSRTQTVRFVLEVSDTAAVTLKVDPSVVLATREYVDTQRAEHEVSRAHPAATTEALGFVEKATTQEAKDGAADKFPDAAGMLAAIDDGMAYQNVAVFEAAGTTSWDVPQELQDGRRKALVTVTGGGGGGAAGSSEYCSGGGAGATSVGVVDLSGVASVEVTVGAGGAGRSPTGPGNSGGSSSFGAYITAPGGLGGKYQTGSSTGGPAGVGGDINIPGGDGTNATVSPSATLSHYGGTGGASYFRGGSTGASNAGEDATHGAGGGGNRASGSNAGGDGIVIVRW